MLKRLLIVSSFFLLAPQPGAQTTSVLASDAPAYTSKGQLLAPANYREWIFLTSGIDMSYAATASGPQPAHSVFDNVFVNPSSYRSFLTRGTWPEQTTIVLEIRSADNPVSINKTGHTQAATVRALEIHVKDQGKWSFYNLAPGSTEAKLIPPPASCYACHQAHAAVDTTFVQFYPTLLQISTRKQTLSPAYLTEIAAPAESAPAAAAPR
jgi:hypothetical protein